MDQTNQLPQTNNTVTNDFLVTQQVNPATIPTNQISSDLEALKKAESNSSPTSAGNSLAKPMPKKKILDPNTPQELVALHVQNPFTGE